MKNKTMVTNIFQKFLLTCCLILAISQVAQATIKYVKPTASGTGDGSSWTNASDDLQAMINAAGSGDEVWVAAGTYLPTRDITGNTSPAEPRDKTFFIDKDIEIYGGFPNTGDPGMADRDWKTYPTILSGDFNGDDASGLSGSDLVSDPSRGDNANSVVFTKNVSSAFVMDGFHIQGGNASAANGFDFKEADRSGGGWYNDGDGLVSSPTIRDCSFQYNSCLSVGGAMFNNASNGGTTNPSYFNCSFLNSNSNSNGGAVYNMGRSSGTASPTFTNCSFENSNANDSRGGAIYNDGSSNGTSSPSFVNCSFLNSTAGIFGGAVHNIGTLAGICNPSFTNCSFTSSHAGTRGGAVYNDGQNGICSPTFSNCIFWENTAGSSGPVFHNLVASVTISHSLVEDVDCATLSTNSNGNVTCNGTMLFNQDPLFVDAPNGDLRLQPCSPAIDAGTATNAPTDDLDGNPRPLPGTAVDMGAYEYQSILPAPTIICPANITADVDAGICCATLSIAAPTGSGNCSPLTFSNDYNGTNDASDVYFPGETIVNWTATDGLGNSFTCQHSVTVEDNEAPVLGYTDEACYTEYEVCLDEQEAYTAQRLAELEIFIANCNGDPACLQEAAGEAAKIDEEARKLMARCFFILNGCDVIPAANNQLPDIVVDAPAGSCEIELNPGPVVMENCATFTLTNDFNSNGTGEGTYPVGTTVVTWTAVDQYGNTSTVSRSITVIGVGDADCDGVSDGCDICPGGDDSVDNNGDGIPDCSQLLPYDDYSEDWKCGNNKLSICHVDEFGNHTTLCLNKNALPDHFSHGDWAGPCQNCAGQNLVAPNNNGIGTTAAHARLSIFPNPANGEVRVVFQRHAPTATIRITDLLGRVVFEKELAEGVNRIVVELEKGHFENGMYLVSISENGETTTKQLVVIQ